MSNLTSSDQKIKIRVLIVEDRPLAREELRYLLSLHPDIEVAGECEDTATAWPLMQSGAFDGVFLDIDIETEGHRAGLDLAIRIDRAELAKQPWIIFTTGFENFALTAHQVRPFGYLVKPINDAELNQVLAKVRKIKPSTTSINKQMIRIRHRKQIQGEIVTCIKYVTADEILYIQSENNTDKVKIKLIQGELLENVNIPLKNWLLDLPKLIQIHKCQLVNIKLINGLNPDPFRIDGFKVTFKGFNDELAVGRTHLANLLAELERLSK